MDYVFSLVFLVVLILGSVEYTRKKVVKTFTETAYEDRDFPVKKEVPMIGLLGTKFPDIKLYDLERDEYGQIIEESPLYAEIAKWLLNEMKKVNYGTRNFDINKIFVNLNNRESESYKTYVHIMRVLTNVNFEAFVNKKLEYNFTRMNRDTIREIESHVDTTIVEVGTYMIERIIEMTSSDK